MATEDPGFTACFQSTTPLSVSWLETRDRFVGNGANCNSAPGISLQFAMLVIAECTFIESKILIQIDF